MEQLGVLPAQADQRVHDVLFVPTVNVTGEGGGSRSLLGQLSGFSLHDGVELAARHVA